jgi:hypothetical protein
MTTPTSPGDPAQPTPVTPAAQPAPVAQLAPATPATQLAPATSVTPALASPRAGVGAAVGSRLAALLLGAASIAWTAVPLRHTGLASTALVIAVIAVAGGALRLAFADIPVPDDQYFLGGWLRAWLSFLALLRTFPWEETAVVAVLWLEIQHPVRPWPTAALGAALVAYLLTTHIAESGADAAPLLRRQRKVLAVGACLLALGAGLAMIPAAAPGGPTALLRVLAAAAVIAATALVLPA